MRPLDDVDLSARASVEGGIYLCATSSPHAWLPHTHFAFATILTPARCDLAAAHSHYITLIRELILVDAYHLLQPGSPPARSLGRVSLRAYVLHAPSAQGSRGALRVRARRCAPAALGGIPRIGGYGIAGCNCGMLPVARGFTREEP